MDPVYFKYFELKGKTATWEAVANSIMELGETASLKDVAKHSAVPISMIEDTLKSSNFKHFFEKHLLSRGFDGVRFQEHVRRVNYLLIDELLNRVEDKKTRQDMTDKDIQGMLMSLNACVRTAAQTEEILAKNEKEGKRLLPPDEIMRRMLKSASGRKLLKVVNGGKS